MPNRVSMFGKLHELDDGMDDIAFRATENEDGTYSITVQSDQMDAIIANQQTMIALLTEIRDNEASTIATTTAGKKGKRTTALLGTLLP